MDEEEENSEKSPSDAKDIDGMVKCMAMWMSRRYFASGSCLPLPSEQSLPVDEEGKNCFLKVKQF